MIRHLIIILFFLNCPLIYGQKNDTVAIYYNKIYQAELLLIDDKLHEAVKYYKDAFNLNISFPIDVYNAFRASYLLNDTAHAIYFANKIFYLGVEKRILNLRLYNNKAYTTNIFFEYITNNYDSINNQLNQNEDAIYIELQNLLTIDQDCRNNIDASKKDSILLVCDQKVADMFKSYFNKYGFPSFNKVGLNMTDFKGFHIFSLFDLLLWHHRGNLKSALFDHAVDALNTGEYDARMFMMCWAYSKPEYKIYGSIDNMTADKISYANKLRAQYYIAPLEEFQKKLDYQTDKNGKYKMDGYFFLNQMYFIFYKAMSQGK